MENNCPSNGTICSVQSIGPVNQLYGMLLQTIVASQLSLSPDSMWPDDYGETAVRRGLGEYDFIIIGAGSAGCVLANRLSENSNWSVLLLEAGKNPAAESRVPALMRYFQRSEYDWQFSAKSKNSCWGYTAGCSQPRGKMLGGCDSLNGIVAIRGNDRDYNWEELGNPSWNWNNVLQYFKKSEANQNQKLVENENGKYHNASGILIIDSFGKLHPFAKVVIAAAREFCHKQIEDLIPDNWLGYTYAQGTIHNGQREGVAKNFLSSAKQRPNLHVIKNAVVEKIKIVNKKAVAVEFNYKGQHKMTAKNKKDVVLSAGTLASPQILMLSGIGPEIHLKKFGIPVNANLSVGENLQDHATLMLFFQLELGSTREDINLKTLDNVYSFAVHHSGSFSGLGLRNLIAFWNTRKNSEYPDVGLQHFYFEQGTSDIEAYASGMLEPARSTLLNQNKNSDMLGVAISLYRPKSRGTVRLSGLSISDKPDIDLNFLSYEEEMETFVSAIKQQVAFSKTNAFRAFGGKFIRLPIPKCGDSNVDEYYRCYVHNFCRSNHHQVGTSKMGPDSDSEAVVDSHLRVRGIQHLRQIDAGIMPLIPSANTNLPTIMVAEKGADFIKMAWHTQA